MPKGSSSPTAGGRVLHGIDVDLPAGTSTAVVGETGSGKTTFAKLLKAAGRPTAGRLLVGGIELRDVAPVSRHVAVRMVPQDGFLFDTTVRENVRMGHEGASGAMIGASFVELGLGFWWVERLPDGLDTEVGERGEASRSANASSWRSPARSSPTRAC